MYIETVGSGRRVATYSRASTPKQVDSIKDQQIMLDDYIQRKDWTLVSHFSDVGTGRIVRNRQGFLALTALIKSGAVDIVLTTEVSRFGRKTKRLLDLHDLCKQHKAIIWDMRLGTEINEMHITALGMVASLQLDVATDQIKRAHKANIKEGLRTGARVYGYKAVEKDGERGHLEKIPEEAEVVERAFKLAADDINPREIARIFNFGKEPVSSPFGKRWRKANFTYKGVLGLLHNRVYCGDVVYGRTETGYDSEDERLRVSLKPTESWFIEKGKHEPIVSRELFDKVQARWARPSSQTVVSSRRNRGPSVFLSGLLKCPVCASKDANGRLHGGSTISTSGADNGRMRVRCVGYAEGSCTNNRSFYRDDVQRTVLAGLVDALRRPENIQAGVEQFSRERQAALSGRRGEKSKLAGSITRLNREIENLANAVAEGGGPEVIRTLKDKMRSKIEERAKAETSYKEFAAAGCSFQLDLPSVQGYLDLIERLPDDVINVPREKLDVDTVAKIESLIDRVYVFPNANGRGFEVEVYGSLAKLVCNGESYRAGKQKSIEVKHMLDLETIAVRSAAENLKLVLCRQPSQPIRTLQHEIRDLLSGSDHPIATGCIADALTEQGVKCSSRTVAAALHRHRDKFAKLRSGFMLRDVWVRRSRKWFVDTDQVVQVARRVLAKAGCPISLQQILDGFNELGYDFLGGRRGLGEVLTSHREFFENVHLQKGIWRLRQPQTQQAA